MSSVETGQMSAVETGQAPGWSWLLQAAMDQKVRKKPVSFSVFELVTRCFVCQGRRSVSPSIDFYNNFSPSSSATRPPHTSIGLLKSRQNPSVQALFGELSTLPCQTHDKLHLAIAIATGA